MLILSSVMSNLLISPSTDFHFRYCIFSFLKLLFRSFIHFLHFTIFRFFFRSLSLFIMAFWKFLSANSTIPVISLPVFIDFFSWLWITFSWFFAWLMIFWLEAKYCKCYIVECLNVVVVFFPQRIGFCFFRQLCVDLFDSFEDCSDLLGWAWSSLYFRTSLSLLLSCSPSGISTVCSWGSVMSPAG